MFLLLLKLHLVNGLLRLDLEQHPVISDSHALGTLGLEEFLALRVRVFLDAIVAYLLVALRAADQLVRMRLHLQLTKIAKPWLALVEGRQTEQSTAATVDYFCFNILTPYNDYKIRDNVYEIYLICMNHYPVKIAEPSFVL